ncbi:MAG: ClbS/DfsB family four-helix bundle protein [Bacteroides sp.]|nr:ClbS/DfsB family four-helix bundle protein [Bacteroides sp.]
MARPTNKQDLLTTANRQFDKLCKLIDTMPGEKRQGTFSFADRDRNLRDVLIHLYEWHQLFLNWVRSNKAGVLINFLPEPYNWKTYPQMNMEFWKHHQTTHIEKAIAQLKESHAEVLKVVEPFTDEELFIKKYFPWTGSTHLGSYAISTTSSHYDWAIKKLKKHIKE